MVDHNDPWNTWGVAKATRVASSFKKRHLMEEDVLTYLRVGRLLLPGSLGWWPTRPHEAPRGPRSTEAHEEEAPAPGHRPWCRASEGKSSGVPHDHMKTGS